MGKCRGRHNAKPVVPGEVFGFLTVIRETGEYYIPPDGHYGRAPLVLCRCACGTLKTLARGKLQSGHTGSCGCEAKRHVTKHRQTKTRVYRVWQAMKSRCERPRDKGYVNYGARGITVCTRWQSFEHFYADMGEPPVGLTLDRIDNNGHYSPENCHWANHTEQARNQRRNVRLTYEGETHTIAGWAEKLERCDETIRSRLRYGWSLERALFTPSRRVIRNRHVLGPGHDVRKQTQAGLLEQG